MRRFLIASFVFVSFAVAPAVAYAQASIVGSVKDNSGAVMPGVTVEASSPALIEKTRSVVTSGTGQYAIVDLRPGTYTVTFTLPGFNTIKRDGIELTGNFVASVSVEMRVGAVEETITVSGEAPTVDVTSSKRQQTISGDVIAAIPSSRQYFALTTLVPALNIQGNDIGGASGPIFSVFQIHGGRRNEGQVLVDGLSMGFQGMGVSFYVPEVGTAQEVTFSLSGGLGEAPTGGPQMNIVPKAGGNTFSGSVFVTGANGAMQGDNITQEIRDAGLSGRNELKKLWEFNPALGGPIRRDRLWFYGTFRHQGNRQLVAGMFENRNAGDPTKWTYDPDPDRQAIDDGTWKNGSLRLTWQATPRNKFNFWWDEQSVCQHCEGGGSRTGLVFAGGIQSPEAHGRTEGFPQRMAQATWSSPASNRLLLEASLGLGPDIQFGGLQKNTYDKTLIRVTDQGGSIPNLAYRAAFWSRPRGLTRVMQGSLSYVTGSHNAKFGGRYHYNDSLGVNFYNDSQLGYTFLNGSPTQLTMFGNHDVRQLVTQGMASLYAQDQWTRGRLTLQGGVRFEHLSAEFPDQQIGPNLYIPVPITFAARDSGVGVKDIMPRMGAAYDLFGNGRTAVKVSVGRYVTPTNSTEAYAGGQNPINRVATMTNRSWTDSNRNFVPDCDLLNPALNAECGPWSNQNFGKEVFTTTYDPDLLTGWNKREYSWDWTTTVSQQLAPRVSVELSYARRVWGNFQVTDNRAVGPADFDPFTIVAPQDQRLPNGGGYSLQFYDINPAKFGQFDNFITFSDNFGKQIYHFNGIDLNVNARFPFALTLQGGFSTGNMTEDDCEVGEKLPEIYILPGSGGTLSAVQSIAQWSRSYCHRESGYLTHVKGLATYTIPKVDVLISGTIQSKPYVGSNFPSVASQSIPAYAVTPNIAIAPSLGRPLAGGAPVTLLGLVQPGEKYGDRLNQVDLRFGKVLRFGTTRTLVALDLFNAFNTNTTDVYQTFYRATYLNPASVMAARLAKISAQLDF
jgi:Carboxypeptidase regulatory-like domain